MSPAIEHILETVCWTRMQSEAGQPLKRIIDRKDTERRYGDGLFFWGIGNAPSRAIPSLVRTGKDIDVLFSIMKSKPKYQDTSPSKVVAWRSYVDAYKVVRPLPPHVLVTSRASSRDCHYALVCHSDKPLELTDEGPFDPMAYRNIGACSFVGSSQVTALLERWQPDGVPEYRIAMRAKLTGPLWVKLVDPVELTSVAHSLIEDECQRLDSWVELVSQIKLHCTSVATSVPRQPHFFGF